MNEAVTGIIHVHSDFSRDGLCSIADLAGLAREAGFRFVGLTDHAEDLSSADLKDLRRLCEEYSDDSFVMIPGLEFRCSGDIHILGLGIADPIPHNDPIVVASQIAASGGLAILAHPGRNGHQCPRELCNVLHGIEIWNASYDGRFVPTLASFHLLQEARRTNHAICGFGGPDFHGLDRNPGVILELRTDLTSSSVDTRIVLHCLKSGTFRMRGRYVAFDAHTAPNWLNRLSLWAFRKVYEVGTAIRDVALGEA